MRYLWLMSYLCARNGYTTAVVLSTGGVSATAENQWGFVAQVRCHGDKF